jgi:hypothetical protein
MTGAGAMGTPMPTPNTTRGAANKELPASKAIANNFVFIFVPPFTTCPKDCSPRANFKSLKKRAKRPFPLAAANHRGGFGPTASCFLRLWGAR